MMGEGEEGMEGRKDERSEGGKGEGGKGEGRKDLMGTGLVPLPLGTRATYYIGDAARVVPLTCACCLRSQLPCSKWRHEIVTDSLHVVQIDATPFTSPPLACFLPSYQY